MMQLSCALTALNKLGWVQRRMFPVSQGVGQTLYAMSPSEQGSRFCSMQMALAEDLQFSQMLAFYPHCLWGLTL